MVLRTEHVDLNLLLRRLLQRELLDLLLLRSICACVLLNGGDDHEEEACLHDARLLHLLAWFRLDVQLRRHHYPVFVDVLQSLHHDDVLVQNRPLLSFNEILRPDDEQVIGRDHQQVDSVASHDAIGSRIRQRLKESYLLVSEHSVPDPQQVEVNDGELVVVGADASLEVDSSALADADILGVEQLNQRLANVAECGGCSRDALRERLAGSERARHWRRYGTDDAFAHTFDKASKSAFLRSFCGSPDDAGEAGGNLGAESFDSLLHARDDARSILGASLVFLTRRTLDDGIH